MAAATLVFAAYLARAVVLLAYPWDWSPDEGLALDYGRRVIEAPSTLYGRQAVAPFPSAYGPVLPLLMAVAVRSDEPLWLARVFALAWTAAGTFAVFLLVRRRAGALLGLGAAALSLAPFDLTYWHMLVRVDGLMQALWLAAAVAILPPALRAGADRLSSPRLWAGTALLLAAVLTKPTAALHGAPIVLGWWLVDRRSALRLTMAVAGLGLGLLALLQWVTHGGFLWVAGLWRTHPTQHGLSTHILQEFAASSWPVVAICLLFAVRARNRWREWLRDPAWLLLAGGLVILPTISKAGAWWNYLLPALAALGVLTGRLAGTSGNASRALPAAAMTALALTLAAHREFPLPTPEDERTARAMYAYVLRHAARAPGPMLVSRPDLASYLVGQPAEIEGSSFPYLVAAGAPGTEAILRRLQEAEYTLIVETWPLPRTTPYQEAVGRSYPRAGVCVVSFFFGRMLVGLRPRADLLEPVPLRPGVRCGPPPTLDARP